MARQVLNAPAATVHSMRWKPVVADWLAYAFAAGFVRKENANQHYRAAIEILI